MEVKEVEVVKSKYPNSLMPSLSLDQVVRCMSEKKKGEWRVEIKMGKPQGDVKEGRTEEDIIADHVTSHHITSHHIISYHIISHHITSHHITSHHLKYDKKGIE